MNNDDDNSSNEDADSNNIRIFQTSFFYQIL